MLVSEAIFMARILFNLVSSPHSSSRINNKYWRPFVIQDFTSPETKRGSLDHSDDLSSVKT